MTARLRAEIAASKADLDRHAGALAKLQGELVASRQEAAGAREETVQFRGMVARAEAATRIEQTQLIALRAEFAILQQQLAATQAAVDQLHASLSWRITAPVRRVLWTVRGVRGRLRPSAPPPAPPPLPADPNERYLFKPGHSDLHAGGGPLTVELLYTLSREL